LDFDATNLNLDASRVFDGFVEMSAGMNGGIAASLIQPNQCALARDFTFRGAYPKTRPAYLNHLFAFSDAITQSHWAGKYQGACWYQVSFGSSGFVISRGGRLFFLRMGATNVLSEITPQIVIVTTASFIAPNAALAPPGNMVVVPIVSETPLTVGDSVVIDGDDYLVVSLSANSVTLENVNAATGKIVPQGTTLFMSDGVTPFKDYKVNPSWLDFVYLFQAETYVIILAENQSAVIFDGSSARLAGIGEVPSGVLGAYGWGRIWITLNDRKSFMAGDIVFGSSGTQAAGFRDAILKFTENDFYNEGGAFGVPAEAGPITAMQFLATQDTSLGVGVLLVGTTNMIFSVNAPVDRTTWKNLQYPIETISLLNSGTVSPRGNTSVNGDWWYRSADGIHSFFVSRRDFGTWGNTPMSREISPILDYDTEKLLYYGSAVLFDNRVLFTTSPYRTAIGVAHRGLVSDNFDLISSQQGKTQPAWEGSFSGLNIFQVLKATYDVGRERCFMFVANDADEVGFWELQRDGAGSSDQFNYGDGVCQSAIFPLLETKSMTFEDGSQKKSLHSCEIFVDQVFEPVTITVKFRPDQYPSWITWQSVTLCSSVKQCAPASDCSPWITRQKTYAARIMLTQPSESCNDISGTVVREGYEFQFRLECSGSFRLRKFKPHAKLRTDKQEGDCASYSCKTFAACDTRYFNTDSHCVPPGGGVIEGGGGELIEGGGGEEFPE
jgi:hypothetical protein